MAGSMGKHEFNEVRQICFLIYRYFTAVNDIKQYKNISKVGGEVIKFVELGIFLYNSKSLLSFLCSINLVSRMITAAQSALTFFFLLTFFLENLYPLAKSGSQKPNGSSLKLIIVLKSRFKQVGCQILE